MCMYIITAALRSKITVHGAPLHRPSSSRFPFRSSPPKTRRRGSKTQEEELDTKKPMCGRARCTLNADQVARACGLSTGATSAVPACDMDRFRPSYNVSPGAYLPVVAKWREKKGEGFDDEKEVPVIHCMKWGLIPSFTKKYEKPDRYKMFNARSESIKEKASFRRLVPKNRCLVAVEGFYEWKKDGSKKQPYYIHFKDHRPLVFAGLYDAWRSPEGETLHTFTIVTTESSKDMQWLHDRMPVILGNEENIDAWLNKPVAEAETVLRPYEDADLLWYPVTTAMGKPSFEGPECSKEIQLKSAGDNTISKFFSKEINNKNQVKHEKESEEPTLGDGSDSLKEETGGNENQEFGHGDTNVNKTDQSFFLKKRSSEPDARGIKREFDEITQSSGMRSSVKKERTIKNIGDKQASLLSYFGRK